MMRLAALVSALSVLVAWMLVLVEPSDYDGASGLLMLFGVPALCVAVLCIVVATRAGMSGAFGGDRRWLWWPLCVMPAGVLAALAVSVLRSPDYFIGEDSPWMLLWMPFLLAAAMLLGTLVDTTAAGYYQLAWVVAAAVAGAGQSFGMTYHEPLRESGGDLSAAPPLRNILRMAALGGSLLLIIGICLFAFGAPAQLATTMMIMGGFAALRICIFVLQVILYTQRRDVFRLTIAVGLVPVKLGMVAALATLTPLGAVGAAIAATVADAIMLAGFTWAVYRPREVAES